MSVRSQETRRVHAAIAVEAVAGSASHIASTTVLQADDLPFHFALYVQPVRGTFSHVDAVRLGDNRQGDVIGLQYRAHHSDGGDVGNLCHHRLPLTRDGVSADASSRDRKSQKPLHHQPPVFLTRSHCGANHPENKSLGDRIVKFVAHHNRTLAYALSATVVFHLGFYAAQVI